MSRCSGVPRPEEVGESVANIGVAHSKGGGWGGSQDTEGDRDDTENR